MRFFAPRLDGGLWNAHFGPAKQQAEMRAGVGCVDKMVIDFEEKRGPAVRALSAYDAVGGSHRRHLGAKVRLLKEPLTSPYG
jgi:hypothetical protein